MRIHTDLTRADVHRIIREGKHHAYALTLTEHGTRTAKARGLELQLTGTSTRQRNSGFYGAAGTDDYAATWDEWGIVLAGIFAADPTAIMGSAKHPVYADADDYHWKTGDRFRWLTTSASTYYHANHTWRWAEGMPMGETRCKCGAVRRYRDDYQESVGVVVPSIRTTRARRYVGENLTAGNVVESRTGDLWRLTEVEGKPAETLGHDDRGRTVCAPWVHAYPVTDPHRAAHTMMASYFVTPAVSYPERDSA